MNINEQFPSKYLKASDLQGRKHNLVIAKITSENITETSLKPVIYFKDKQKGMVMNKTNATIIASGYGPETDGWAGKNIVIYPAKVSFQNQMVDAIRVELPIPEAKDFDDDVGF